MCACRVLGKVAHVLTSEEACICDDVQRAPPADATLHIKQHTHTHFQRKWLCLFVEIYLVTWFLLGHIELRKLSQVHRFRQQAVGGEEASSSIEANTFLCCCKTLLKSTKKLRAYVGLSMCSLCDKTIKPLQHLYNLFSPNYS